VSDIMEKAPDNYKSPLQEMVYESLTKLQISFERVNTDEAIAMEDCIEINQKLDMKMVKTLFCNCGADGKYSGRKIGAATVFGVLMDKDNICVSCF